MIDSPIRVLIADNYPLIRTAIGIVLGSDANIQVVAEARSGHEVVPLALQHRPDLVILDIHLPGQSGLAALKELRQRLPSPPRTLVLSSSCREEDIRVAYELGVAGYLLIDCDLGQDLCQVVHKVVADVPVFSPAVAAILTRQRYTKGRRLERYADGTCVLSPAERDVVEQMMRAESAEEIASALGRQCNTVRSQSTAVLRKLNVRSRQRAVVRALELGIVHLDLSR